jgi:hypothetical protein
MRNVHIDLLRDISHTKVIVINFFNTQYQYHSDVMYIAYNDIWNKDCSRLNIHLVLLWVIFHIILIVAKFITFWYSSLCSLTYVPYYYTLYLSIQHLISSRKLCRILHVLWIETWRTPYVIYFSICCDVCSI